MVERWALSEGELANPHDLRSDDELVAEANGVGVLVYRNGEVSNRFDDGTAGVPEDIKEAAGEVETLLHPNGEPTSKWVDVLTNDGAFAGFAS